MKKKYVVWFHYNKQYSRQHNADKWSVHFRNVCHIVDKIICKIPTESRNNKRQPRVVMRGMARQVVEKDGVITIE